MEKEINGTMLDTNQLNSVNGGLKIVIVHHYAWEKFINIFMKRKKSL